MKIEIDISEIDYKCCKENIPLLDVYERLYKAVKDGTPLTECKSEDCISREFQEIVVEYPPEDLCTYPEYKGKPYFSIKYKEGSDYFIGYGTYKPEVLSRYLRDYFMSSVTLQEPKCKDCKWWKDSDGAYRRGVEAESQCPINRREVFKGNGYCYLFEPQKSKG